MARISLRRNSKTRNARRLLVSETTAPERGALLALPGASLLDNEVVALPPDPLRVADITRIASRVDWSDEAHEWYHIAKTDEIRSLRVKSAQVHGLWDAIVPWGALLYPYQSLGARWLTYVKRAILGDEMGLGKTLQAITAAFFAESVLVVTVNLAKRSVWEAHLTRHCADVKPFVCDGTTLQRQKVFAEFLAYDGKKWLIINHEMLQSRFAKSYPALYRFVFDCAIYDEAHKFQDHMSSQSLGAAAIKTGALYLLTGTPVWNKPENIFGLLRLIDPDRWASYWTFVKEYCEVVEAFHHREIVGIKPEKLKQLQLVLAPILLMRKKEEVLADLPTKRVQYIDYALPAGLKKVYITLRRKYRLEAEDGTTLYNEPNASKMIADLRRLINDPSLLALPTEGPKTAMIDDLLDEALSEGHKVVIFTWHIDYTVFLYNHLASRGIAARVVSGGVSEKGREEALEAFRADPAIPVLIASIATTATAIDLTVADVAIFAEGSHVPTLVRQAEARLHRIGQTCDVMMYRLRALRTIESVLWETVDARDDAANELTSLRSITERVFAQEV